MVRSGFRLQKLESLLESRLLEAMLQMGDASSLKGKPKANVSREVSVTFLLFLIVRGRLSINLPCFLLFILHCHSSSTHTHSHTLPLYLDAVKKHVFQNVTHFATDIVALNLAMC